jgi:Planctomycete cytochrome C
VHLASSVAFASTPAAEKVSVAFFASRVAPIFEDRCTTCHGPQKKKGKLLLDSFAHVMLGGKDGMVVKPGDPKGSELFRRITLPRDHKDAMPAEGKPGLTATQIKVIEFWIASGAEQIVAADEVQKAPPLPSPKLVVPSPTADYRPRLEKIQALQSELGIQLVPRSQDPRDGLILRTVSAPERCNDSVLAALEPVADLIVDAELARTKVTDTGAKILGGFPNLLALDLSHTAITSRGLAPLQNLNKLESLNLTATSVDDPGVQPFRHKPGLRHLYFFETRSTSDVSPGEHARPPAPK